MSGLLDELADSETETVELALHLSWPDGTEDWMKCANLNELNYRYLFWSERGLTCTPLSRIVTTGGWVPDRPAPCGAYSNGTDGWCCAATGPHDQHHNAAGDVHWGDA